MKTVLLTLIMTLLAACSPLTISGEAISVPVPEKADAAPQSAFAGTIAVGTVGSDRLVYGALEQRELIFENAEAPLKTALASGGYLVKEGSAVRYVLDAEILEIVNAVCMFGDCITHATVAYTLTPKDAKQPIWQRRLKTPFHFEHSMFSLMDDATHRAIIGGAVAHNYQEAVRQLSQAHLLKSDEKPKPASSQKNR